MITQEDKMVVMNTVQRVLNGPLGNRHALIDYNEDGGFAGAAFIFGSIPEIESEPPSYQELHERFYRNWDNSPLPLFHALRDLARAIWEEYTHKGIALEREALLNRLVDLALWVLSLPLDASCLCADDAG